MVGHDGNAPAWVLVSEQFDLFDRGVKIIAGMNNKKQLSVRLEFTRQ
jgi:hypothetical protein